jgi:hypothetical protein
MLNIVSTTSRSITLSFSRTTFTNTMTITSSSRKNLMDYIGKLRK